MVPHEAHQRGVVLALMLAASLLTGCEAAEEAGTKAGSQISDFPTAGPASTPEVTAPEPVTDASTPAPTVTKSAVPGVPEESTPQTGPGSASAESPATVAGIRVGRHATFDRVVIDFSSGPLPSYEVAWVPQQERFRRPGSGQPVQLEGNRVLEVTLRNAVNRRPVALTPRLRAVREVRSFGSFEGVARVGIGVSTTDGTTDEVGFRVMTIKQGPPRLVIDIAHPGAYSRQLE